MNEPPKPKHRWYQFSLRTLLIVMLLLCFGFAWIGSRMSRARENQERVAKVEEAFAAIRKTDWAWVGAREERRSQTWLEELFDDPGDEDDPVSVLKVEMLIFVLYGSGEDVTDTTLVHVKKLTDLRSLDLSSTEVSLLPSLPLLMQLVIQQAPFPLEPQRIIFWCRRN